MSELIERCYAGDFFKQKMTVRDINFPRLQLYKELCKDQKVLHVGCTDFPIMDDTNLHIQLADSARVLHGLDTDREGIEVLKQRVPGKYFCAVEEITEQYDLVLVPEVVEHVPNIQQFLSSLDSIDFDNILISAPCIIGYLDAFSYKDVAGTCNSLLKDDSDYIELVHPHHNVWFSPYTLANCIFHSTSWLLTDVCFLDQKHSILVSCVKSQKPAAD